MTMSGIKLLLADVDGTLVTKEKVLTERAVNAVRALKDKGILFAITSGRPPRGMKMLIDPLQLDDPIAGFNGGVLVNPDLSLIEEHTLDPDMAKKVVETMLAQKIDVWIYRGQDWFIRDKNAPHAAKEERTVQFAPTVVDTLDDLLDKAIKIVGVSDDEDLMKKAESAVKEAIGDKATAALSQPYYLDVTHKLANKGYVVEFLAKRYGIDAKDIATIGDMPNDVIMFEKSGLGIAMGNATKDVQDKARFTTDSNENEGFAKAVEDHFL
jgi:Cof subfamily protein (haloacid dehalogenase superfamily)